MLRTPCHARHAHFRGMEVRPSAGAARRASGNLPQALLRQVPRERCLNPVTAGWPPASGSEDAGGDATGGALLPRPADAGPAQHRVSKASASGILPQAIREQVREGTVAATCHRRPASGYWKRRRKRGRNRRRTAGAIATLLPDMSLYLTPEFYVNVPLETT
jgi:hypothetical protein